MCSLMQSALQRVFFVVLFGTVASAPPPRQISWWWDAPLNASDPEVDGFISFCKEHPTIVTTVIMECGITTCVRNKTRGDCMNNGSPTIPPPTPHVLSLNVTPRSLARSLARSRALSQLCSHVSVGARRWARRGNQRRPATQLPTGATCAEGSWHPCRALAR